MKKWFTGIVIGIILLGGGTLFLWETTPYSIHAQTNPTDSQLDNKPIQNDLKIKIYDVPKAFHEGYITILSEFITSSEQIRYPENAPSDLTLSEATESVETDIEEPSQHEPVEYVQYDSKRNIIVVLAALEEHQEIQQFLNQLKTKEEREVSVIYRMAMVERDIHPKLKNYPYEFFINGKCWDDGRNRHKYPKWMDDRSKKFPSLLFVKVDTDRDKDDTKFWVKGYAKSKKDVESIFHTVEKADDTNSDTKMIHHDFMKESHENLNQILSDIFPNSQLHSIIHSLQDSEVYQVEAEAKLASESAIPGFFRTVLGDNYGVEILCEEGIRKDGQYNIEVHVFKKRHDRDSVFEENNRHLSTTLITQFGQIHMIGIRHHNERYVLLFSMEQTK